MKSLLLGNGINRLSQQNGWEDLLRELILQAGNNVEMGTKPFPLLYEEILLKALGHGTLSEDALLKIIVDRVAKIAPNEFHQKFIQPFDHILTTNYDYTIESILAEPNEVVPKSLTKETTYSLYRVIELAGKRIWHIHGEAERPKSICLGFERYGANIQKIRNFIINGSDDKHIDPLAKRIDKPEKQFVSWVDYIFFSDVHIVGLGLDFQEIDLWWLLDYRARQIQARSKKFINKIVYYCSGSEDRSRIDVLKALGVEVNSYEIGRDGYHEFYNGIAMQL